MFTEAPRPNPALLRLDLSWNVHIYLTLMSRLEWEEHFTGFIQHLILFLHPTTSVFADFIIPLDFKDISFSRLDRAPAVSYPGCEGKNCSAAPSLPPAQMHLGKGWTAHHHLKQEAEETWFLENKHVDARAPVCVQLVCVCVCLYPLCQSFGWQPRGAQGGRSRSAARRWKERTELCRSPWNPSDQICENIIVSEVLKENHFIIRQVWLKIRILIFSLQAWRFLWQHF